MSSLGTHPKQTDGFTLVELAIALAIVSVLLAIVFPTYQYYFARARVGAALAELSSLRTNYEASISSESELPALTDLGVDTMNSQQCVFSLSGQTSSGAATLSCSLTNVPVFLVGGVISYNRAVGGAWACQVNAKVSSAYLPAGCSAGN